VGIFEGPPPGLSEILEMVSSKLHRVPHYRQLLRSVPFDLGCPVWTDDPYFNLRYHARHTALPAPGGEDQLRNQVRRVMAQRLDRGKPLWKMWIVEGLRCRCVARTSGATTTTGHRSSSRSCRWGSRIR
jgi:hypothetical protein